MKTVLLYLGILLIAFITCTKEYSSEAIQNQNQNSTTMPATDPNGNQGSSQNGNQTPDSTQSTTPSTDSASGTSQNGNNSGNITVSPYFLKCKVDGIVTEYRKEVVASKWVDQEEFSLSVQGHNVLMANPPGLSLIITDKSPISTKTYSELNNMFISSMQFRNEAGTDFSSGFVEAGSGFTTTITELTNTGVKGTFSGNVADVNSGKVLPVTEGEFYAKF